MQEPLVPRAAVVERQVADHAQTALVRGAKQRVQSVVAPEQRIDAVEAGRVIAVRAARGEERRQIDDVRAEALDVVEMVRDAVEVAAVQLARRVASTTLRQRRPLARDGPLRTV